MLRLALCLLLAKSAFAANRHRPEHLSYGPIGPDTNLVYNFQQIRRDQPPLVELREENVQKYSGRPRTTSPVPTSKLPVDDGDMEPMPPLPYNAIEWDALQKAPKLEELQRVPLQKAPKHEEPVQKWKNVPAPPSFPNWDSLSNLAVTNPKKYESLVIPQQQLVVPFVEPAQRRDPSYMSIESTSTFAPRVPAMREPVAWQKPRDNAATRGRGTNRFDWTDATGTEPSSTWSRRTPGSAPTPAPRRMPPPAVPTLSPWQDGF